MKEDVKDFYEFLVNDETARKEFEEKAKETATKNEEAVANFVITYAKDHGYEFSLEDIKAFDEEGEMSAEDLEAVSGGAKCYCAVIGAADGCGCFIGGGGKTAVGCSIVGVPRQLILPR